MEQKLKDTLKCMWMFLNLVIRDKICLFDYQIIYG